jgi:hypothetical protein
MASFLQVTRIVARLQLRHPPPIIIIIITIKVHPYSFMCSITKITIIRRHIISTVEDLCATLIRHSNRLVQVMGLCPTARSLLSHTSVTQPQELKKILLLRPIVIR